MKKSKFSEAQIVKILGEVSWGKPGKEVCTAHGLSEATFNVWKRKYAGMENDDLRRLRELTATTSILRRKDSSYPVFTDGGRTRVWISQLRIVQPLIRLD